MTRRLEFRLGTSVLILALATSTLSIAPATSSVPSSVTTCVNLESKKERISKTGSCRTGREAIVNWRLVPSDTAIQLENVEKNLTICSNKESSPVVYQIIRDVCGKAMKKTLYTRTSSIPAKPMIKTASSNSHESISLILESDPSSNLSSPVAYFTIVSNKGDTRKVFSWRDSRLTISGLQQSTTYTFTVTATNVDGTSQESEKSLPVNTQVYVPVVNTQLVIPAFTLSSIAETRTVNTSLTGYSISSTGGTISSFSISPAAPTGTSFNTSTGLLSGTPISIAAATTYTITATNSAGTATRTFTLTVSAIVYTVGQTGPGGGIVFYVATTPFACGPTRSSTCNYLEAAPPLWNGGLADPSRTWANSTYANAMVNNASSPQTATATAIGWGYWNTRAIILQGNTDTATSAAALADAHSVTVSGVLYDDWYLPSREELIELNSQKTTVGGFVGGDICGDCYWSSSDFNFGGAVAWWVRFPFNSLSANFKNASNKVRPIRAF